MSKDKLILIVYDSDGGGLGAHIYNLFQCYSIGQYLGIDLVCIHPLLKYTFDLSNVSLQSHSICFKELLNSTSLYPILDSCQTLEELKIKLNSLSCRYILCGRHHYHKFFTKFSYHILGTSRGNAFRHFLSKIGFIYKNTVRCSAAVDDLHRFHSLFEELRIIEDIFNSKSLIGCIHVRTLRDSPIGHSLYVRSQERIRHLIHETIKYYKYDCLLIVSDSDELKHSLRESIGSNVITLNCPGVPWHSSLQTVYGPRILFTGRKLLDEVKLIAEQVNQNLSLMYVYSYPIVEWHLMTQCHFFVTTGSCYSNTALLFSKSSKYHVYPFSTYSREYVSTEIF